MLGVKRSSGMYYYDDKKSVVILRVSFQIQIGLVVSIGYNYSAVRSSKKRYNYADKRALAIPRITILPRNNIYIYTQAYNIFTAREFALTHNGIEI